MNFHQSPQFEEAILKASEVLGKRALLIEKDYWVTLMLRNLSLSKYKSQVVFKGGTSLSKAYDCIERFSEDVDLAILKEPGINDNQLKKLMKKIESEITAGLTYIDNHSLEEKRGRNRRTFYNYPKAIQDNDFGSVKDTLQLEINSFTHLVPYQSVLIESYIAIYLKQNNFESFITDFNLQPFELNILTRERTFFEKLLSLIRLSYNGVDTLKGKIRHFYDLLKLYEQTDFKATLLTPQSYELVDWVKNDDKENSTFAGDWLKYKLSESPLFSNIEDNWKELTPTYTKELKDISWSKEIPSPEQILSTLNSIKTFLIEYDSQNIPL